MASYQLLCSVVRPSNPTEACQVTNFQEKITQHSSTVIRDFCIPSSSSSSSHTPGETEMRDSGSDPFSDGCLLFALVAKTVARLSGAEDFGSQIELPRYWCNMCPFDTPSKPCLLQHLVDQHCFMCPVCPFAAFTRFAVVRHGVGEHPTFQKEMFRQKLKGLGINRSIFQDLFEPVRTTPRPPKRGSDACGESTMDKEPAKQMRMSSSHCHVGEQCSDTNNGAGSSSSGTQCNFSADENLIRETESDTNFDLSERSASRLLAVLASSANLYSEGRSVGENVVSSSGMDADSGGDVGSASCGDTSEVLPSASPAQPVMEAENKMEGVASAVEIKQEVVWPEDSSDQANGLSGGNGDSPLGVHVKLEKDQENQGLLMQMQAVTHFPSFPNHSGHLADGRQDTYDHGISFQAHPSASPPLSCMRVENLQQQFEESVCSIDISNYPEQPLDSLTTPRSLEKIKPSLSNSPIATKQGGLTLSSIQSPQNSVCFDTREMQFSTQPVVENFLLEKPLSKNTGDLSQNSCSTSPGITNVLRYLLTRTQISDEKGSLNSSSTRLLQYLPTDDSLRAQGTRLAVSNSPVSPPRNSAESSLLKSVPTFLQPSISHRKPPEKSSYNLLSSLLTKNMSNIQDDFHWLSRNPLPASQDQEPSKTTGAVLISGQEAGVEGSEESLVESNKTSVQVQPSATHTFGQRQPAVNTEKDLVSLVSNEQSSPGVSLEVKDSLTPVPSMRVRDSVKLPGSSMPHLQLLLKTQFQSLRPQEEQALHSKRSGLLNLALTTASVQRKMNSFKSYSNMSLRDILTMTTSSNLELDRVSTSSSKEDCEDRDSDKETREDDENKDVGKQIKEENKNESEVVWECEFCDFSGAEKYIVTSHRESQHADLLDDNYEAEQTPAPWQKSLCSSGHGCPSSLPGTGNKQEESVEENTTGLEAEPFCPSRQSAGREVVGGGTEATFSQNYQDLESEICEFFGDDESLSDSSSEADDPEDVNYIPPKSLQQLDSFEIQSSPETDGNESTFSQSRRERKWRKKTQSRPVQHSRTWNQKLDNSVLALESKRTLHPYACLYCSLDACSLKLIKDHIRYSNCAVPHFFKARVHQCSIPQSSSVFICPRQECHFTNTSPQHFLEHVLACQGHIFAAGMFVLKVLTASLQQKALVSGAYLCSVASCHFSSADLMVMRRHLFGHIMKMHAMLMVFMRSIASAITDIHATCTDWYPFLCFLCSRGISSLSAARVHMQNEHNGLTRGVFHLEKNSEIVSPGGLHEGSGAGPRLTLCCLRCEQVMPQLGEWLCHTCSPRSATPSATDPIDGGAGRRETNLSAMLWARLLQPEACDATHDPILNVMSLQLSEWPWYIRNGAEVSVARTSESVSRRNATEQVPIIRRILTESTPLSQLVLPLMSGKTVLRECSEINLDTPDVPGAEVLSKHQDPSADFEPASQQSGSRRSSCFLGERSTETKLSVQDLPSNSSPSRPCFKTPSSEIDTDSYVECNDCEEFVPERQWKNHDCFHQAIEQGNQQGTSVDSLQSKTSILAVTGEQNTRSKNVLATSDSVHIHSNTTNSMRMGHQQQSDLSGSSKDFIQSDSRSLSNKPDSENDESALMLDTWTVRAEQSSSRNLLLSQLRSEDEQLYLSPGGHVSQAAAQRTDLQKNEEDRSQVTLCSEAELQAAHPHVSQLPVSPATAVQCSVLPPVNSPAHRSGPCSARAAGDDAEDIVAWLHQQGSHVMRVLGNALDGVDSKQQL